MQAVFVKSNFCQICKRPRHKIQMQHDQINEKPTAKLGVWQTCSHESSRKSVVAWKTICSPKRLGGLSIFNLVVWNKVTMMKCFWNLCRKLDNMWVKLVHMHYLKAGMSWKFWLGWIAPGWWKISWILDSRSIMSNLFGIVCWVVESSIWRPSMMSWLMIDRL